MSKKIPKININEFVDKGFLQEANRLFFHPLGLALEVTIDEDGEAHLSGVWDYRDDPEGMFFSDGLIKQNKIDHVEKLRASKETERIRVEGSCIQAATVVKNNDPL